MDIFSLEYPVIKTNRLVLRPLESQDLASLYELYNSPDTQAFQSKHYYSVDALAKYIFGQVGAYRSKEKIMWAMETKADRKLIGVRILYNDGNNTFEVQGDTRKEYWRQGYTKEAYSAVISYLKNNLDNFTVYGKIQAGNSAAKGLLESLRFINTSSHEDSGIKFMTYSKQVKRHWLSRITS